MTSIITFIMMKMRKKFEMRLLFKKEKEGNMLYGFFMVIWLITVIATLVTKFEYQWMQIPMWVSLCLALFFRVA